MLDSFLAPVMTIVGGSLSWLVFNGETPCASVTPCLLFLHVCVDSEKTS